MTSHCLKIGPYQLEVNEIEPFVYEGQLEDLHFTCRRWTWGQKNLALDMATRYHKPSQKYYTDTIVYNENMLRASTVSLRQKDAELDLSDLDAHLGDILLELCLWANQRISGDLPSSPTPVPQGHCYVLESAALCAVFKAWSWGEKMNAVKAASVYNPEAEEMQLLNGKFGELLLAHTLTALKIRGQAVEVILENIRNLPLDVGDLLVEASVAINSIPATEKKT